MGTKDLRNGKESVSWKPHKWSTERVARARTHALNVAYNELSSEWGQFHAGKAIAELYAIIDGAVSRERLAAAGVPTIGA